MKFRQFCAVKDAAGKNRGQTFTWDVYSNISSQGTTLVETNTMPEGQATLTQGTLTITEYGNSIPYSGKLEALAESSVKAPLIKALKNDATKALDLGAYAQFNTTLLRVIPVGGTATNAVTLYTNGTVTGTASVAFNKDHHKAIIDVMKERNIPAYSGDDYYALSWPTTLRRIKNDLEGVHQYTTEGLKMIMNGEIGRFENARFVEQTNVAKAGWANTDWIFFLGDDAVAEGISEPVEIRAKIPSDFGRSKGVAWYTITGFGKIALSAAEERIVKWDSLA